MLPDPLEETPGRQRVSMGDQSGCTLSPKKNKDLVLGFGPITYDSWNRRKQTEDWVAIGLVAPTSAQRLVVSSTATTTSMTLVEQVEVFKCELADLATACMSAHRLVVRSTNTTMAATAPDDEMAITQPAAMSIERESAKDVISAKSLHGCSGDLFVYAVWICGPGFSCIGPHPSAPDSEDVYARRALHGPPMCAYVTNERWERVDRTNTFRRTEGNGGCCAGDNNRKHHVTRACCCCHLHCYHVMDAFCCIGLQPTCFHGYCCQPCNCANIDLSPERHGRGNHHNNYHNTAGRPNHTIIWVTVCTIPLQATTQATSTPGDAPLSSRRPRRRRRQRGKIYMVHIRPEPS